MKKKHLVFIFIQLLIFVSVIAAQDSAFRENFQEKINMWINGELSSEVLYMDMGRFDTQLSQQPESWENLYWRSRVAMIRGQIHMENEEKDKSLSELEKCQAFAQRSIGLRDNSDSWRMLAESTSLFMLQKDFAYIIKNYSRSQEEARKALELDPDNSRASLVIAQFLGNAPKIAGGNINNGIKMLRNLSERKDLSDEDRFYILTSLCELLEKDKKYNNAYTACAEALRIFPGNERARSLLRNLETKR